MTRSLMAMAAMVATGAALIGLGPALAQTSGAPEGGAWTDCQLTAIAVFRDRIQLTCATPVTAGQNAVTSFAVETQGGLWQPALTLAVEAQGRKRPLSILYVKAGEANPAECDAKSCRRLAAAALK